jgi:cold shock CspA family protein
VKEDGALKLPLEIAFENMPHSEAVAEEVRAKADKLDEFCGRIMRCRVVIAVPHKHHEHGNYYQVRIDLTVPGEEIAVNREAPEPVPFKDVRVAIRDAFAAARRKLEDYARRHRHDVKSHEPAPHAKVARVYADEGYGFLETPDGREVYFHRNSVLHGQFDGLQPGTEVTFVEEAGEKGPQASTVAVIGRHHHA